MSLQSGYNPLYSYYNKTNEWTATYGATTTQIYSSLVTRNMFPNNLFGPGFGFSATGA